MRCAADFRAEARAALKGRWGLAIGIGFLAMVLGGIAGVGGLDVNFVMVEGNFQMTLDIFGQRLNPVEMMRNIGVGSAFLVWQYLSVAAALVAIVRLIVGSFVGAVQILHPQPVVQSPRDRGFGRRDRAEAFRLDPVPDRCQERAPH